MGLFDDLFSVITEASKQVTNRIAKDNESVQNSVIQAHSTSELTNEIIREQHEERENNNETVDDTHSLEHEVRMSHKKEDEEMWELRERQLQEEQMWKEKEEDEAWEEYHREIGGLRDQEMDFDWHNHESDMRAISSLSPDRTPDTPSSLEEREEEREVQPMEEEPLLDTYYDEEEEDEGGEVEEDFIDNSDLSDDLSSQKNSFAIRLNDERNRFEQKENRLEKSGEVLCRRFPIITRFEREERLPYIINTAFPDGMQRRLFIRKISFNDNNRENIELLGIRPEMMPGNPLSTIIGEDNSLIFIGHIHGREFVVDRISDVANTECLPFEVECVANVYADSSRVEHDSVQFLYTIRMEAESLTDYTTERLTEWKEYLQWREEIVKMQIKGCKYYKITVDETKAQLIFHLIFESKEQFQQFRKYLYRGVQAFSNDYSRNEWHFDFNYDDNIRGRRRYHRSVELGACRGVRSEYEIQTGFKVGEDTDYEDDDHETAEFSEDSAAEYENEWDNEFDYDAEFADDDYDEEETDADSLNESVILREYRTPYIVEMAYEVNSSDADQMRNLKDEDVIPYIKEKIVPRYDEQGFLALSAVGQFSVIRRQRKAVEQLERGESYSPNLGAWIFNVKQARVPETTDFPVRKWLNPAVASNDNQRKAVEGMLCTEDVCLVQGPPGTGKTTVIAEAVYQLVTQGKRVLIASQSNDAVDNALERLADTPEIRAIRMGQAARRRIRGEDFAEGRFSEVNSLQSYYHSLAEKIDTTWLKPWEEIQSREQQYDLDLRNCRLLGRDVDEFEEKRHDLEHRIHSIQQETDDKRTEREESERRNLESIAERNYFEQFRWDIGKEGIKFAFHLSARQLEIVGGCLNPVVSGAKENGILIVQYGLSVNQLGIDAANNALAFGFEQISLLKSVLRKISEAKQSTSGQNVEVDRLRIQRDRLQQLMEEAEDEEADAYYKEFKKINRQLKEIGKTNSALTLSSSEKTLFETKVLAQLQGEGKGDVERALNDVISSWNEAIEKAISKIEQYLNAKAEINLAPFDSALKRLEGQMVLAQDDLKQVMLSLQEKQKQLEVIGQKYRVNSGNRAEIEQQILTQQTENERQAQQQAQMRADWEDTIRRFSARLNDATLFSYDSEFFLPTYIQSCNVVGTSCTDRILTGTELGYFDVVIIDEVSKVTPPELLLPLMKARKAILVGDHRQLPPMFEEHEKSYSEVIGSEDLPDELKPLLTMVNFNRFKKMVTASLFKDMFESADDKIKYSLLTQYRMHSDIMDIINRFYDYRLVCGLNAEQESKRKKHGLSIKGLDSGNLIVPNSHAYWIDSSALPSGTPVYDSFYDSKGNSRSTSAFNALEYYLIIELLKKLDEANKAAGGEKKTVGVISFYQRQINELRNEVKRLRKQLSSLDIDINTVDRFQGKEKQIIITSLVRNNPKARAGQHVVAFERINVAFSRAQELLVIVGARHMYENLSVQLPNMTDKGTSTVNVYKNIINLLERKASFKTSAKLLSQDMEKAVLDKCREGGDGR